MDIITFLSTTLTASEDGPCRPAVKCPSTNQKVVVVGGRLRGKETGRIWILKNADGEDKLKHFHLAEGITFTLVFPLMESSEQLVWLMQSRD